MAVVSEIVVSTLSISPFRSRIVLGDGIDRVAHLRHQIERCRMARGFEWCPYLERLATAPFPNRSARTCCRRDRRSESPQRSRDAGADADRSARASAPETSLLAEAGTRIDTTSPASIPDTLTLAPLSRAAICENSAYTSKVSLNSMRRLPIRNMPTVKRSMPPTTNAPTAASRRLAYQPECWTP